MSDTHTLTHSHNKHTPPHLFVRTPAPSAKVQALKLDDSIIQRIPQLPLQSSILQDMWSHISVYIHSFSLPPPLFSYYLSPSLFLLTRVSTHAAVGSVAVCEGGRSCCSATAGPTALLGVMRAHRATWTSQTRHIHCRNKELSSSPLSFPFFADILHRFCLS